MRQPRHPAETLALIRAQIRHQPSRQGVVDRAGIAQASTQLQPGIIGDHLRRNEVEDGLSQQRSRQHCGTFAVIVGRRRDQFQATTQARGEPHQAIGGHRHIPALFLQCLKQIREGDRLAVDFDPAAEFKPVAPTGRRTQAQGERTFIGLADVQSGTAPVRVDAVFSQAGDQRQ